MPDGASVTVNIPDFMRQIREIGSKVEKKVARRAVNAGASVFKELAKRAAPVLREPEKRRVAGALKKNIITVRSRFARRDQVLYNVGVRTLRTLRTKSKVKQLKFVRSGDPFYWYFLERGWTPRGPGRKLRGGERKRRIQRKRNLLKGAKEYQFPFLEPAFEQGGARALETIIRTFDEGLTKEAKGVR